MRPVDADEIVKRCEDVIRHGVADNAGQHRISAECVMSAVKALPTVDAVPVRHGRWMLGVSLWYCSECGSSYSYGDYAFCPNCGADMRKEGEKDG